MTSAKRWLNCLHISQLALVLTFTTLPDVGKQRAGRRRQLHLGLYTWRTPGEVICCF